MLVEKGFVRDFYTYTEHENICILDKCMIKTSRIQLQMLYNLHRHQLLSYALSNMVNE